MADEKLNTGPAENTSPKVAEPIATPEQAAASEPRQEQTGPAIPEPSDVVVSFDKINELMAEKRQNARAEVEKAETPEAPEAAAPGETPQPANTEEPKKPRRGRPPKAEKAATENQKAEKSAWARKDRPPKADKAAPDKPKPARMMEKFGQVLSDKEVQICCLLCAGFSTKEIGVDRKSTRLNSSHNNQSRMPSSA